MKLIHVVSTAVFAWAISSAALAETPDFSALSLYQNPAPQAQLGFASSPQQDYQECMRRGWNAAYPSPGQNARARDYMNYAASVYHQHEMDIRRGMDALRSAWMRHPISHAEVSNLGNNLRHHITPVMIAGQDAQINVINLLSFSQRDAFDRVVYQCMKSFGH